jgi:hypothetical protein
MTALSLIPVLPTILLIDCRLTRYLHQKAKQNPWFRVVSWYKAPSIGDLIKIYDKSRVIDNEGRGHRGVPHFEHEILKDDWAPELWYDKEQLDGQVEKSAEEDGQFRTLTRIMPRWYYKKWGDADSEVQRKGRSRERSRSRSKSKSRKRRD